MPVPVKKWKQNGIDVAKWSNEKGISYSMTKTYKTGAMIPDSEGKMKPEYKETKTYFKGQLFELRDLLNQIIKDEGISADDVKKFEKTKQSKI